jgi:hypothetical protein
VADPPQLLGECVVAQLRRLTDDHAVIVEQHISLPVDVAATTPEMRAINVGYGHPDTVVPIVVGRMLG